MAYSKGNWKIGIHGNSVITDNGEGFPVGTGHDEVSYYGGYLIAESILNPDDAKLIAAAPELKDALGFCITTLKALGISEDHTTLGGCITMANEAIKKATE